MGWSVAIDRLWSPGPARHHEIDFCRAAINLCNRFARRLEASLVCSTGNPSGRHVEAIPFRLEP
jgi:hypothetical protein